jgi:hypothetical protein
MIFFLRVFRCRNHVTGSDIASSLKNMKKPTTNGKKTAVRSTRWIPSAAIFNGAGTTASRWRNTGARSENAEIPRDCRRACCLYGRIRPYNQFTKNRPLVGIVSDTNRAGIVAIGRFAVSSGEWRRERLEDLLPFLEDGEQQVIDLFAKSMEARSVKS